MDIFWRPYQIACKRAIKENYDKGISKQLIVQCTGSGKRMQAVSLAKHFNRTLFIAHREELIIQAYEEIDQYWPMQVGIIKASRFELEKRIVVASVQTLHNRLDRIAPDTFQLVIVDEAHHFCSRTFLKTARHFIPKLLTGWTATPKRLDGLSLSNIFDDIIFRYTIEDGIRDGYLAPMEAYQIKTATDISDVKRTAGDFNIKQLSEKIDSELRNNLIVHKYKEYTPGMQAIAYCVDMDHAYNLRDKFIMNGISCATIVSDKKRCPDRTEIIKDFRNREIDVITNVNILTEGFDYDDIGCVIMGRPTQSETLYVQAIGRGTRQKSLSFIEKHGTNKCTVLDFVDNTGKHSLVNAWELERGKPIEDRIFLPEKYKELLLIEKEKRDRRLTVLYGTDKKINLVKLPVVDPWNSAKMYDPATEKQLKWIKDMGVYQEGIEYTKAMASELIGGQKAADWQLQWLGREKYDVSNGATLGQFQKVKWMREKKAKYEIENKALVEAQNLKNSLL